MSRVRLTLGQAYWLACAHENPLGCVPIWDGAPDYLEAQIDGIKRRLRDIANATQQEANGLIKRGLMTTRANGGVGEITDKGRAALALRPDLVRELADRSDAHAKREADASDAADREWYASEAERTENEG